jgi:predicted phosphodiesterase
MTQRRAAAVAVLADIHGNLPALRAVLAEADVADAEAVVLLGDIALGPMPAETLDVLAGLGERAVWVHGNCEREMITAFDGGDVPGPNGPQAAGSAALMGRPHRDMLDGLPLTVTVDIDGLGPTLFCHASPRRDDEMLLVDSPPERWAAALSRLGSGIQVVVCGHTHMQFDTDGNDRCWNTGGLSGRGVSCRPGRACGARPGGPGPRRRDHRGVRSWCRWPG